MDSLGANMQISWERKGGVSFWVIKVVFFLKKFLTILLINVKINV